MGLGVIVEPAVVLTLLFGGTWVNRNRSHVLSEPAASRPQFLTYKPDTVDYWTPASPASAHSNDAFLDKELKGDVYADTAFHQQLRWRRRELHLGPYKTTVATPDSRVFKHRRLSRLLVKFPFLVEVLYWALIYWVYQLGRAFTAVTLVQGTVHVAREHAIQLIHLEQALGIFRELAIQHFFLQRPVMLSWANRIYSYIHIPGTILFLVWLYWLTTTRNRIPDSNIVDPSRNANGNATPQLYQARRRTMALCNLIAFVVFTTWPCMPPRLLSDPAVTGPSGAAARLYGFVDTVHGDGGQGSVWTQNRFCNQYAAMPSLHFGYSLLIGLTVATIPLPQRTSKLSRRLSAGGVGVRVSTPNWQRALCVSIGFAYPFAILVAIIATANHFILDAVAGAFVCLLAWKTNALMLNLLPLQDYFLWCIRTHFPDPGLRSNDVERDNQNDDFIADVSQPREAI